jgi:tetratricopeptide (TPR) repeat protein
MAVRIITLFVLFAFLWGGAALAQDQSARISGKILADGRPVNQEIEVRLESQDGSLAAFAYTRGSFDFTLAIDSFDPTGNYFLVIRNPNYKEFRYPLESNSFSKHVIPGRAPGTFEATYTYSGIVLLELESVNPGENAAVSRKINGRDIPSNIPETAVKEYSQAVEAINQGNRTAAITHLEKAVELAPDYFEFVNKLGVEYLKEDKYEKAEEMLERARTLDPKDKSSRINLGIIFVNQGEKQIASASADPLIDLDLDEQKTNPGESYFRKAIVVLEEASKLDSSSARLNFYLGTAEYHLGEYAKAEPLLLIALLLDRQMQDARLTLIDIYKQQKRYNAVLKQIEAYLAANSNTPLRDKLEKLKTRIETLQNQK